MLLGRRKNGYWNNPLNRLRFLKSIEVSLNIEHSSQWYKVRVSDLLSLGGRGLLERHGNSLREILKANFPETKWIPWLFPRTAPGFWRYRENREQYLAWLAEELQIYRDEDWYRVTVREVIQRGGSGFLDYYGLSMRAALCDLLPQYQWKPWLFQHAPRSFWKDSRNRKQFFEWIFKLTASNSSKPHDKQSEEQIAILWSELSLPTILQHGGHGIIKFMKKHWSPSYSNQLRHSVNPIRCTQLSEHNSSICRHGFSKGRPRTFRNIEERREFLRKLSSDLSVIHGSQWHSVRIVDVREISGGRAFLEYYSGSLSRGLLELCPSGPWKPWLFSRISKHTWHQMLDKQVSSQMGNLEIGKPLYGLPMFPRDSINRVGSGADMKEYLNWLANIFSVSCTEDWMRIPLSRVRGLGRAHGLISNTLEWFKLLKNWGLIGDRPGGNRLGLKKSQWLLRLMIFELFSKSFPSEKDCCCSYSLSQARVLENYKLKSLFDWQSPYVRKTNQTYEKHHSIDFASSRVSVCPSRYDQPGSRNEQKQLQWSLKRMEIDIYVPEFSLAFEYHESNIINIATVVVLLFARKSEINGRERYVL